ncbi:MAG TPA: NCS2 family permease, partial [Novosphingobium sp.]|nr:NCS2 family permease [Novosphingobium sp.]
MTDAPTVARPAPGAGPDHPLLARIARHFAIAERGTSLRTEVLAGCTTFLTMAYIVLVNPSILGQAGMPVASVAAATCFAAGFASILMGVVANVPLALAPGMGLNAYFTFTVVQQMHVPWPVGLGCVLVSGVVFLLLTLTGVRQMIVSVIPHHLFAAVAGGIGLFIGFIGLKDAGLVVANPATFVALGDLRSPGAMLALFGLLLIGVLSIWKVRGAMLVGIVGTTLVGAALGMVSLPHETYHLSALTGTAFRLDLAGVFGVGGGHGLGLVEILFVFLFVDLFDNIGTLVAVTKRAGLMDALGRIPALNRILVTDAVATMVGALAGTSTVTSYVESAAGVQAGGRTGLAAVVTGVLFLATMFVAPYAQLVPLAATAPALIIVGGLMLLPLT